MKILMICYLFLLVCRMSIAQPNQIAEVDSFDLQEVSIQDTILLRVIPEYISARLNHQSEKFFPTKGVLVLTVPRKRDNMEVCYRIHAEYDNYGILKACSVFHPLFFTKVANRYVLVCDEWTGALISVSSKSVQKAIALFHKAGWLDIVASEYESRWEIHNGVYCWKPDY